MNFINLTPHAITIFDNDNKTTINPSGIIARVSVKNTLVKTIYNVPRINLYKETTGEVINLPETKEDTGYIVSLAIRKAVPNRNDLFSPTELVRDNNGNVLGCNGLTGNFND